MKSRRFGLQLHRVQFIVDETGPNPKKVFLFQMSKKFSKNIFNGPQNLNELIQELPFATVVCSLRLKQMPFHRQERRVCSIHTPRVFKKNCWDIQDYCKMQSSTVLCSMCKDECVHSTNSAFVRWVCGYFLFEIFIFGRTARWKLCSVQDSCLFPPACVSSGEALKKIGSCSCHKMYTIWTRLQFLWSRQFSIHFSHLNLLFLSDFKLLTQTT